METRRGARAPIGAGTFPGFVPVGGTQFAHAVRPDEAVFAAYGWNSDLGDEEILEKLLSLNLERAKS
jgi:hypothetical protein